MSNDRVMPGFIARGSQAQHRRIDLIRVTPEGSAARTDEVSVEEPLDIVITTEGSVTHVQDTSSITMRTPGNDDELILGFLYSEGIVNNLNDVVSIEHSAPANSETGLHNSARVTLASEITFKRQEIERQFTRSSSCGVCGRTSLETLLALKPIDTSDSVRVTAEFMQRLPDEGEPPAERVRQDRWTTRRCAIRPERTVQTAQGRCWSSQCARQAAGGLS